MQRFLIWGALALTCSVAGCQTTTPAYRFPCTPRAIDAGFCEYKSSFRLVDRLAGTY